MKRSEADQQLAWVALCLSHQIGRRTLERLQRHFAGDLSAALSATPRQLRQVRGLGKQGAEKIARINLDAARERIQAWQHDGIAILTPGNPAYPARLQALDDAPPLLFARGCLQESIWARTVAVVGRRQPSDRARFLTLQLALHLARAGVTVVSGLALGIDTAAHQGALEAGGATVAVLGSGLRRVYPAANRERAQRIEAAGALISQVPPDWGVNAQRLVARNRIISGLAQRIVLVESGADGGAMYTVRFAHEQGRAVYAFDLPASGNQLALQNGAKPLSQEEPLRELLA